MHSRIALHSTKMKNTRCGSSGARASTRHALWRGVDYACGPAPADPIAIGIYANAARFVRLMHKLSPLLRISRCWNGVPSSSLSNWPAE